MMNHLIEHSMLAVKIAVTILSVGTGYENHEYQAMSLPSTFPVDDLKLQEKRQNFIIIVIEIEIACHYQACQYHKCFKNVSVFYRLMPHERNSCSVSLTKFAFGSSSASHHHWQ